MPDKLRLLQSQLDGDLFTDEASLLMYSTDASVYRERPMAVVRPKNAGDIKKLIQFAAEEGTSLIPRTAGTSLAGQVVGGGIIVDVSKYMCRVLEINEQDHWVRVEPGVVLDELNKLLEPSGLFFGPETSTSNRCMVGGMVGNNSCGAHSIIYGSTRDHTLEVKALLSDGSEATFGPLTKDEFDSKCRGKSLENKIYQEIWEILSSPVTQDNIRREFPHPEIKRRNTGYAIDLLLNNEVFGESPEAFNFCKLIAGSEGTLAFMTEIKLNLVPLPPKEKALVCIHCNTLEDAFRGNLVALQFRPVSIELIDHIILECTKENIEQTKNRFFIQGEPAAVLVVEFAFGSRDEVLHATESLEKAMRQAGYGYYFPVITGPDMNKVWALRKAGLGLLSNVPGDAKPVTIIEDTAIRPVDLPDYMQEFKAIIAGHGLNCVYYAHIASGELHLKPVLNFKDPADLALFRTIGTEIAGLVKKYRGSLSGEHGDGRLRGEFIPFMIGDENYQLLKRIKACWDPRNIFNPGKITATPPMDVSLRYQPGQATRDIKTVLDFSRTKGILRAVEQCNGSGDCRKSEIIGGTMCPSFMATRDEKTTTRARANILREFLTNSKKENPFNHREIYDTLDLCLSCKACKAECPSNVDMAAYKAEFLQHWYDANGAPLRSKLIANISAINKLGMIAPGIFNFFASSGFTGKLIKHILGFAPGRSIPLLSATTLRKWARTDRSRPVPTVEYDQKRRVYLFADEFTDYNDTAIGISAIRLLNKLGYEVIIPEHRESGRTFISKGFLYKAKEIANANVSMLKSIITKEMPLIGIEPSGILTFRDEYPALVDKELVADATILASNTLFIEEFIVQEFEKGNILMNQFTSASKHIKLHGHCQQKAVASTLPTRKMLEIPENYRVEEIKSGCCGMAGSFGYEKEHYELSMKVGEMLLFPEVRKAGDEVLIAAPGTSCRHQIFDGTGKKAFHPVEIFYMALK